MSLDSDLVRVDLLKVKRKLYLSYPVGSKERSDFLAASKLSELNYLSKLVPPDLADLVFTEYKKLIRSEVLDILMSLGMGICASLALFSLHTQYSSTTFLHFWHLPFWFGLGISAKHVWNMVFQWRKMKPFHKEYQELQRRISKLNNELKDIR
jgi:hypothetical protein